MEYLLPPTIILQDTKRDNAVVARSISTDGENAGSVSPFHVDSSISSPSNTTLRDLISQTPSLYYFCVVTGMIMPFTTSSDVSQQRQYMVMRAWVVLVHVIYFLTTVFTIIGVILYFIYPASNVFVLALDVILTFLVALEMIAAYFTVVLVRKEMGIVRPELAQFPQALPSILSLAYSLLGFLVVTSFVMSMVIYGSGDFFTSTFLLVSIFACFLLCGGSAILIGQQRVSYFVLQDVQRKMEAQEMSQAEYWRVKKSLDERDQWMPLNLLMIPAATGTLGAIVRWIDYEVAPDALSTNTLNVIFMEMLLLRESIIMLILLYEMAKVNEIYETYLPLLSSVMWGKKGATAEETGGACSAQETERLRLALCVRHWPIGAKVYFFQPSRMNLLLQIGSILFSVAFAIISKIVSSAVLSSA